MAVQFRGIAKLVASILSIVIPLLTKAFREEIEEQMLVWWTKAVASENPWDDWLIEFLATMLKIQLPPVK